MLGIVVRIHDVVRLGGVDGSRQGEGARFRPEVDAVDEVHDDRVLRRAGGATEHRHLDTAGDDRQVDTGVRRDLRGPRSGAIEHQRCVVVVAGRGDPQDAIPPESDTGHRLPEQESRTVTSRRIGVPRHRQVRVGVAAVRLVHRDRRIVDPEPGHQVGHRIHRNDLGPNPEPPVHGHVRLGGRTIFGGRERKPAGPGEAALAAQGIVEPLEHVETVARHPAGQLVRVVLPDDGRGAARPPRPDRVAFQYHDLETALRQMVRRAASHDAGADHCNIRPLGHGSPPSVTMWTASGSIPRSAGRRGRRAGEMR